MGANQGKDGEQGGDGVGVQQLYSNNNNNHTSSGAGERINKTDETFPNCASGRPPEDTRDSSRPIVRDRKTRFSLMLNLNRLLFNGNSSSNRNRNKQLTTNTNNAVGVDRDTAAATTPLQTGEEQHQMDNGDQKMIAVADQNHNASWILSPNRSPYDPPEFYYPIKDGGATTVTIAPDRSQQPSLPISDSTELVEKRRKKRKSKKERNKDFSASNCFRSSKRQSGDAYETANVNVNNNNNLTEYGPPVNGAPTTVHIGQFAHSGAVMVTQQPTTAAGNNGQATTGKTRQMPLVESSVGSPSPSDREFGSFQIECRDITKQQRALKKLQDHFDPRLLEKYTIVAMVGKGSFSRVVRVEHRVTSKSYAVKIVPAKNGGGPFENELSILKRVSHPYVIRLIDVFRTSNRIYMVMDIAAGGELYDRIVAKGRYTEHEAISATRMILNGLIYLHRFGITHRDLKPENLLYSHPIPDSRLMITDFGLAHQQRNQLEPERMTDTCGTPEYIAPEVLLRVPYTNKVDMWAIGVITYILMSGIMPFDDENRSRLYRQIIKGFYVYYDEFWSGAGDMAKTFVDALLETDPDERLSSEEAMNHPWLETPPPSASHARLNVDIGSKHRPISVDSAIQSGKDDSFNSVSNGTVDHHANNVPAASGNYYTAVHPAYQNDNAPTYSQPERTKSSRSMRSVTRSDHGHKVNPKEVARLARDPEIKKIAHDQIHGNHTRQKSKDGRTRSRSTARSSDYGTMDSCIDYGVV